MSREPKSRRLAPKGFQEELEKLGHTLRAQIEAAVEGFPADEQARRARRKTALAPDGFRAFCEAYFPHYLIKAPSRLHLHLFEDLPAMLTSEPAVGRPGWRKLKIAPRGSAKSTIATQLFSLWCALRRAKRFIVIAMDTYEQAALMVEAIKVEIESNPRLAYYFPEFAGAGRRWREGEIVTRTDVMILGAGARQALRGKRFGPHRPDLVLLDDIENDVNVESPSYRKKLRGWVEKAVLKLGPADGSLDVVMLGTVLHYDAVLVQLSTAPGWDVRHFRAVEKFPDRMDLWDAWQEVYLNIGEDAAHAFYEARSPEME